MTHEEPASATGRLRVWLGPRLRVARYGWWRFRKSRLAVAGAAIVALYLAVALLAPVIAPPKPGQTDPYQMPFDFKADKEPPSAKHPFGTGSIGVDLFYGVVWGSRISILMGIAVTLAGAAIGVVLGSVAGYYGGKTDEVVMRVTDVFLSMPLIVIAMAVAVALGRGLGNIAIALIVVWWPSYTRLVRGAVLSIRENQYVEAARAIGASDARIIARHVMPNAVSPVMVQATLDIGTVILVSAALSFIGFGPGGVGFAEWGNLVSQGKEYMLQAWWAVTMPGLAIFGCALGFNLLGDGLRDLLDPRLRA